MKDLLEAIQIFLKYEDVKFPFTCEHDILRVWGYDVDDMDSNDVKRLEELGFTWDGEDFDCFYSYKYGSC